MRQILLNPILFKAITILLLSMHLTCFTYHHSLVKKASLDHVASDYAIDHPACFHTKPILVANLFHPGFVILSSSHGERYRVFLTWVCSSTVLLRANV